jgi:hypothetical protein
MRIGPERAGDSASSGNPPALAASLPELWEFRWRWAAAQARTGLAGAPTGESILRAHLADPPRRTAGD